MQIPGLTLQHFNFMTPVAVIAGLLILVISPS
jgi:hypothetical protein